MSGNLDEYEALSSEQKRAILDQRAAQLAQSLAVQDQQENQLDVLEFLISREKFAIETRYIREASKLLVLTPLPCAPDFVLGLINFRGQILPLLDLSKILELKPGESKSDLQVVVVQTQLAQAGIAVDEILGISSIAETDLQSTRQLVSSSLAPLLRGLRGDRLAVLNIEAVMSDTRLIVNDNP